MENAMDDIQAPWQGQSFARRARDASDDDDMRVRDDSVPAIMLQEDAEETLFQQFTRHWMNERHAPDILPAQEVLLSRLLDHVKKQVRVQLLVLGFMVLSAEVQVFV